MAAWNDTAPRFVAYGDSHVANNSLGVPDPSALLGFQYYNIAFWTSENGAADNVAEWVSGTDAQRRAIVQAYNNAGIRLGVSVFGETSKPQSTGNDPLVLANTIAAFVIKYGLQGVDVDYEEYDLFTQVLATKWLIPFTRQLRSKLARSSGYYLSHAPTPG
ncbi:hypothetical protein CBS101457_003464 [Exobasidium rhododendri]|nr:hypothetical protein CBS101457_003464 [Exobasidium rhododendri]